MAQQIDERPPDERRHDDAGPAPAASRLTRWERAIAARRPLLHRVGIALSLTIILFSAIIFIRVLVRINLGQFQAAFAATGGDQIVMAFGLSGLSYLALTGYDALALRHLRVHVPYRLTALASFTSYAVSFTLGFPLVTGGAVRYWIYGPAGLSPGKVASLTVVAGITFWLGMGFIPASASCSTRRRSAGSTTFTRWRTRRSAPRSSPRSPPISSGSPTSAARAGRSCSISPRPARC